LQSVPVAENCRTTAAQERPPSTLLNIPALAVWASAVWALAVWALAVWGLASPPEPAAWE
jgi:hypothetical protein